MNSCREYAAANLLGDQGHVVYAVI